MIVATDIANLALAQLDLDPIQSIDENSDKAKKVRPVWQTALETFLAAHEWSFAKRIVRPAELAIDAASFMPYRYAFALPENLVKLRALTRPEKGRLFGRGRLEQPGVQYEVARYGGQRKQAIFTDCSDIVVEFTTSDVQLDDFSPEARAALASLLASEICLNMRNNSSRANELLQRYSVALETAKKNDAQSGREPVRMSGFHYTDARNA